MRWLVLCGAAVVVSLWLGAPWPLTGLLGVAFLIALYGDHGPRRAGD